MRFHSVDYRDRKSERGLVNRGFWFYLPRLLLVCRLLGHRPVVDGTKGHRGQPGSRWVCCDRCGVRPEPQGSLDAARWAVGDRVSLSLDMEGVQQPPGPWPARVQGVLGGQVIIGRNHTSGFSVKVGNAGSEHTLAAHAGLPFLGAIYLHTERFGTWLQRRLVPAGYESRVIEVSVHDRRLRWQLWTFRDSRKPRGWRNGNIRIDPRDIAWGGKQYWYEDHGDPVTVTVTLPEGDSYPVTIQLQRQTFGRPKGRKKLSWAADCRCDQGIPHRSGWKDGLCGWSVPVTDTAAEGGMWPQEAAAATVAKVTSLRVRHGWKIPAHI